MKPPVIPNAARNLFWHFPALRQFEPMVDVVKYTLLAPTLVVFAHKIVLT